MHHVRLASALGAGLLLAMACGAGSTPLTEHLSPTGDSVTVEVVNENYYDLNLFAVYEGSARERLGLVTGNSSQTFRIGWEPLRLQFEIDLISVGAFFSDAVQVSPGDDVGLRVLSNLHRSDFWRRKP